MNRFLFCLLACLLLISCSGSKVPKDVLPPQKMQAVLWDAMLADEMADYYVRKDSSLNTLSKHVELYQQIFFIHKISKDDFKKSLHYYEAHPDLLRPIFDSLQKKSEKITTGLKPVPAD
ncbi:MAG: DUF4296 domain-containing protein [Flavisolibacter sp.]